MKDYNRYTDRELIIHLTKGDSLAFEMLYNRYWDKLLYLAHQKTNDLMEAENMVQDIFVSLWNRRKSLDIKNEISHYLIVSVKYRVIRLFAKQRNQQLRNQQNITSFDILDNSTQQYLDFEELKLQLEKLMGSLPEKPALIFRLSREEGYSHQEIAEELNISVRAVNESLVKTKKTLSLYLRSFLNTHLL